MQAVLCCRLFKTACSCPFSFQCSFTIKETVQTIRGRDSRTSTSTFTQLLSSELSMKKTATPVYVGNWHNMTVDILHRLCVGCPHSCCASIQSPATVSRVQQSLHPEISSHYTQRQEVPIPRVQHSLYRESSTRYTRSPVLIIPRVQHTLYP